MLASGADIPAELFKHILHYVVFSRSGLYWTSQLTSSEKHELAASALVSRYWADQCRPWLFQRITLRSFEDVWQLHSFIQRSLRSTRVKPISDHLETLCIVHRHTNRPWIHLIALYLLPILPIKFCELSLEHTLQGVSGSGVAESPFRSIFQDLPVTLPSVFTPYKELSISNMSFKSTIFFKLIGELTQLEILTLQNIQWVTDPDSLDVHFPLSLREVSISGVHKEKIVPWLLSALLVRSRRGRPSRAVRASPGVVDMPEHDNVAGMVFALHSVQSQQNSTWRLQTVYFNKWRKYQRIFFSCVSERKKPLIPDTELVYGSPPLLVNADGNQPRYLFVMHIFMELEQGVFYSGTDWQGLAASILKMQHLRTMVMGFHLHEELLAFVHADGRHLLPLYMNEKLRYVYRHAERETWVVHKADAVDDVDTGRKDISDV